MKKGKGIKIRKCFKNVVKGLKIASFESFTLDNFRPALSHLCMPGVKIMEINNI